MNSKWTKHLERKEDIEKFTKRLGNCKDVFSVLKNILEEDLALLEKDGEKKANYEQASWPYMQADNVGARRTYKKIIELLPGG